MTDEKNKVELYKDDEKGAFESAPLTNHLYV